MHVLNRQVEEITTGPSGRAIGFSLSVGGGAVGGHRHGPVMTGISLLWFLVPGYAIALIPHLFVPPVFTAIAFDSGGVASGLSHLPAPLMGACESGGGSHRCFRYRGARGDDPLLTIQILGMAYRFKQRRATEVTAGEQALLTDEIIDYPEGTEANVDGCDS